MGTSFKDLELNEWLYTQCKAMGLSKPTPIQVNCVPPILEGSFILQRTQLSPTLKHVSIRLCLMIDNHDVV